MAAPATSMGLQEILTNPALQSQVVNPKHQSVAVIPSGTIENPITGNALLLTVDEVIMGRDAAASSMQRDRSPDRIAQRGRSDYQAN